MPSEASAQHGKGTRAPQSQGSLESSYGGAMTLASGPPRPELLTPLPLLPAASSAPPPAPPTLCPPTRQNILALCCVSTTSTLIAPQLRWQVREGPYPAPERPHGVVVRDWGSRVRLPGFRL